jgi:dienelactone hydrolase
MAPADPWLAKPVDDWTFETYLDFFKYDGQFPFDPRIIEVSEQEGVRKEHLSFQSTAGVRVFANFFSVSGADSPRPAMILLHGGGPPGKDWAGMNRLAALVARAGWNALTIDMQHFGERSTDLLTTFTEQDKHDRLYNQPPVYLAWVIQTIKDIGRSYDFLVEQRRADPKRVGLYGFSRGGIVAAIAGGADRRLAAVVMSYGGHFDAAERGHLPPACPANYIGRISPRPLLMLNAKQDTDMVPDRSVEPLYGLAKPPKQIVWSEGGHSFSSEESEAAMLKWLRENLR